MTVARTALLLGIAALGAGCPHDLTRPRRDSAAPRDLVQGDGAADLDASVDRRSSADILCPSPCVTTYAGRCGSAGFDQATLPRDQARFEAPAGLLLEASGPPPTLLVADAANLAIRRIAGDQVITVVEASVFSTPTGLALQGPDDILVSDVGNTRLFEVKGGQVSWIAGAGWGHQDGPAAQARFERPTSLLFVPGLGLLITDPPDNRIRLLASGTVSTWAGNGTSLSSDGGLLAAGIEGPLALARTLDGSTIYVSAHYVIRKIVGDQVSKVASVPYCDGYGIAVDPTSGALLVADTSHHLIRRIVNGTVSILAGSEIGYRDGPGAVAQFRGPEGIVVDADGAIYVADRGNDCIRVIR